MQVWDGLTDSRISFDWPSTEQNHAAGEKTIAYMVENLNLTSGLLRHIDELGGLSIFDKSKVENIIMGPETEEFNLSSWPVVEVSGGRRLAARLLVGADGANSPVRMFADIKTRGWDYPTHGVVATVQMEGNGWGGNEDKVAYQRFLPTGPVALLPVSLLVSTLSPNAQLT
jgi:ubiquinone biosynthesis monooxygenase Coq6